MKNIITSSFFLFSAMGLAQTQTVGVNTETPEATLHITELATSDYNVTNGVIETPHNKVGFKIPTHNETFPDVPFGTDDEIALSEAKNGMLVHFDRAATATEEELQSFYYWDHLNYSWEKIIDNREVNLDTSKVITIAGSLDNTLKGAGTQTLVFDRIETFDDDFYLDTEENAIVIGKPGNFYLQLIGGIEKGGTSDATAFTLNINVNGTSQISSAVSVAANANSETRTANFFVSESTSFNKNDKITVTITSGTSGLQSADVASPFSITLIKLK